MNGLCKKSLPSSIYYTYHPVGTTENRLQVEGSNLAKFKLEYSNKLSPSWHNYWLKKLEHKYRSCYKSHINFCLHHNQCSEWIFSKSELLTLKFKLSQVSDPLDSMNLILIYLGCLGYVEGDGVCMCVLDNKSSFVTDNLSL